MMTIYVLLLLLPQKKATERDRERESEETKGGRVTMAMMLSDFPRFSRFTTANVQFFLNSCLILQNMFGFR